MEQKEDEEKDGVGEKNVNELEQRTLAVNATSMRRQCNSKVDTL